MKSYVIIYKRILLFTYKIVLYTRQSGVGIVKAIENRTLLLESMSNISDLVLSLWFSRLNVTFAIMLKNEISNATVQYIL